MKVNELIAILNKCDPNATVKFDDANWIDIGSIERSNVTEVYEARCIDNKDSYVILTNAHEGEEND